MQTQRSPVILTAVAVLFAAIALAAVGLAIVALNKDSQDKTSIHTLQAQVRALTAHTGGVTASVTSRVGELESKVKTLEGRAVGFSKADGTLNSLTNCIPELQSEIGGLEIAGETYSVSRISNRTNISKTCTATLYGTGG
jgi:hypothetical protein